MDIVSLQITSWFISHQAQIISILLIILGAWLAKRFGQMIIRNAVIQSIKRTAHKSKLEEQKREETIIQIISGALGIVIWPLVAIIIVGQLGVNTTPLIAGVGIIGVALGFGAQGLVKDIIAGLFIITENQYGVGDVVSLDATAGLVEHVSLRVTILRDLDGTVHYVPNGSILRSSNLSKDYSGINLDIGVSYDSDIEKVIAEINKVGHALAHDPKWKLQIIKPPTFLRVDNFGDNAIGLKITGTVLPLEQWEVTSELRKRLKIAFDKADIALRASPTN
jgi:small conductance mechanosensitive channel